MEQEQSLEQLNAQFNDVRSSLTGHFRRDDEAKPRMDAFDKLTREVGMKLLMTFVSFSI
jgi:hypothetical protein